MKFQRTPIIVLLVITGLGLLMAQTTTPVNSTKLRFAPISPNKPVFRMFELESRSWIVPSIGRQTFLEMKIAQFSKHPDLVIMLYGSGASTNCADFYVSVASNAYILVGHDLDVIPIVGVYWKEQDGRPIISLNRSESNGVTKTGYSFELIDEYTLQRNLSTFVSPR